MSECVCIYNDVVCGEEPFAPFIALCGAKEIRAFRTSPSSSSLAGTNPIRHHSPVAHVWSYSPHSMHACIVLTFKHPYV